MDRVFNGLGSFQRFCEREALEQEAVLYELADLAAKVVQGKIKGVFGDKSKLAALSPVTIDQRGGGDDPLLIDGNLLKDSIDETHGTLGAYGSYASVGSAEPILVYHEHGYINFRTGNAVVPRPAFAIGVYEALPIVKAAVSVFAHPGRKKAWSVTKTGVVNI